MNVCVMVVTNHRYSERSLKLILEIQPKMDEKRRVVTSKVFCSLLGRLEYTSMQVVREMGEGRLHTGERSVFLEKALALKTLTGWGILKM